MQRIETKPFSFRALITFSVVISFMVLAITGIVLYIAPPGRIANWSDWRFAGFAKTQWQTIHTGFSLIFLMAAAVHLFFNWKVILGYLKRRAQDGIAKRRELITVLTSATVLLVMAADGAAPFGTLMAWGEEIKNGWDTTAPAPPIAHAELLTMDEVAMQLQIPSHALMTRLAASGLTPDSMGMSVRDLARKHGLAPVAVYSRISAGEAAPRSGASGGGPGYGRKTVAVFCNDEGIDTPTALARLAAAGITADQHSLIRSLSITTGKTPGEVLRIMRGQNPDKEQ